MSQGYRSLVYKALFLQATKGTLYAALWLKLFGFEVRDAVSILARAPRLRG
jgi:hypothetical protein